MQSLFYRAICNSSLNLLCFQKEFIQQGKDSFNLALVLNLKRSLDNFEDEDITLAVKEGVVYVSISDKMLFKSGSYQISNQAENVIEKIAKTINDHKELDILIEGDTDTVPI